MLKNITKVAKHMEFMMPTKAMMCAFFIALMATRSFAGIPGSITCSNDDVPGRIRCPAPSSARTPSHIGSPTPRMESTFLYNDEQNIAFKKVETSEGSMELIILEDFVSQSKKPAIVWDAGTYAGLPLAVLKRDNKKVLAVSRAHFTSPIVSKYLADNCVGAVLGGGLAGAGLGIAGGVVTAGEFTDEIGDPRVAILGKLIGAAIGGVGGFGAGAWGAWGTAASCQPAPQNASVTQCTFEPNPPKAEKPATGKE